MNVYCSMNYSTPRYTLKKKNWRVPQGAATSKVGALRFCGKSDESLEVMVGNCANARLWGKWQSLAHHFHPLYLKGTVNPCETR